METMWYHILFILLFTAIAPRWYCLMH